MKILTLLFLFGLMKCSGQTDSDHVLTTSPTSQPKKIEEKKQKYLAKYNERLYKVSNNENKFGIYDINKDSLIVPKIYDDVFAYNHLQKDYIYVVNDGQYYLLNNKYAISSSGYKYIQRYLIQDSLTLVTTFDYKSKLVNFEGKELSVGYDLIEQPPLGNELMVVFNREKILFGAINSKGNEIIPLEYKRLESRGLKNKYFASKNGKTGIIDSKNQILIPLEYDRIEQFRSEKVKNIEDIPENENIEFIAYKKDKLYLINDLNKVVYKEN